MRARVFLLLWGALSSPALAQPGEDALPQFTGCWVSEAFDATSLLSDASDPDSAAVVREKMWLKVQPIKDTKYLVLSRLYEWDDRHTYVLGPTFQNGAYNPVARYMTFGFPNGGLDHVTSTGPDRLLYVHAKSATDKSAMSVRALKRLDCGNAEQMEMELKLRQQALQQ